MDTTTPWARWATEPDRFDAITEPHIEPLLRGARVAAGASVVDVGCGTAASPPTCSAVTSACATTPVPARSPWPTRFACGRRRSPPYVVDALEADLREALAAHATADGVVVPAATWLLTARAP